jgi:hypothetical protein
MDRVRCIWPITCYTSCLNWQCFVYCEVCVWLIIEGAIGKCMHAVTFCECTHPLSPVWFRYLLFMEIPRCPSNTWCKQVVFRLNFFLHNNRSYLLSNDAPVKVVFFGLYAMSPVIALPFEAFLEVHYLRLSTCIQQFCWIEAISLNVVPFNAILSTRKRKKSHGINLVSGKGV